MIYITGDTHGRPTQLSTKNFPKGRELTKDDYVIIAGDFGLIWDNDPDKGKEEKWWKNWLNEKPWTTLFIDGNHENFTRLFNLPEEEKFGNIVGKYTDSIYHLKRGLVYDIDDLKVFTFGGAISVDKALRVPYKSWWPEELPSFLEMSLAVKQLEACGNEVDIIVTHEMPLKLFSRIYSLLIHPDALDDPVKKFLDHILDTVKFKKWYLGHYHEDNDYDNIIMLYKEVKKICV